MARTPTQKPPAGTPVLFDPAAFLAQLKAQDETLTAINQRCARIEAQVVQASARQADAEKRQDDRLVARLAPLQLRIVSTTEEAAEFLSTLPAQIEQAGLKASQEMAHNAMLAKRMMEGVETAAFIRMQTMRDQAITMVTEVQSDAKVKMGEIGDHTATGMEKARDEAIVILQGLGNSAKNMVAEAGVSIAERLEEAADLGKRLVEASATTAQVAITSTASTAEAEYVKATAEAKAAFDLSKACVISFEASMAELRRIGLWLGHTTERRTWMIAGATGVSAVAVTVIALMLFRGVLWATGGAL